MGLLTFLGDGFLSESDCFKEKLTNTPNLTLNFREQSLDPSLRTRHSKISPSSRECRLLVMNYIFKRLSRNKNKRLLSDNSDMYFLILYMRILRNEEQQGGLINSSRKSDKGLGCVLLSSIAFLPVYDLV